MRNATTTPPAVKRRLLLVDDDPGTIHVLHRMLSPDYELRYALGGTAALQMAHDWQPELVLLDAHMPDMSGTEVCRRLRAEPLLAAVPVVLISALPASGIELLALELGAAGFLSKPLLEEPLLACIQQHLPQTPAATEAAAIAAASPSQAEPGPSGKPDIRPCLLIVDDDPSAVQAVHAALCNLQARFVFATDGHQALVMARLHRPDVILLDLYMPGLDGLDTLRELKADPGLADAQVIIITRYAFPEMEKRALDGGGVDFIAKPYTQAVLQARVANVLRLKRQAEESRQAEREHWQRIGNARLARVVAAASDAIITVDAQALVVLINAAACTLFGVDAAYTIGQPVAALLPDLVLPPPAAVVDTRLQRQRLRLQRSGAPSVPVELSISSLGQGQDHLSTLVLRDLSEQERSEAGARAQLQAETALKAKTLMISYLAHEIGNPLNAVLGFTELMQADAAHPLPPAQAQRLQHVAEAGELLRAMMRDVLNLQRLESGRFDMTLKVLDATQAARRAINGQSPQAARAGIVVLLETQAEEQTAPTSPSGVQTKTPAAPVHVVADETRLQQCLANLLSNAIKYNRPGGQVRLRVHSTAQRCSFEVDDDGPGLGAEQLAHLFEPFNRLGRKGSGGSGIGLALTRLLASAMDGQVTVTSEVGRGSSFVLSLPAATA